MKKVILIEDRPNRQIDFISRINRDLNKITILENVCGFEKFSIYKEIISSDKLDEFSVYDVIIIHRSALSTNERLRLINYVSQNSKTLVLFSGGISSVTLQKINKGDLLTINSKNLYNQSLINYLENGNLNILELAFGKNWKINLEVNFLDKLIFYMINYNEKPLIMVLHELEVTEWIKDNYFKNSGGKIDLSDLEEIKNSLQISLSKSL